MGEYRRRSDVVQAYCYNQKPDNYRPDWFQTAVSENRIVTYEECAYLTDHGVALRINLGDWVIYSGGRFAIMSDKGFMYTYEPVEQSNV